MVHKVKSYNFKFDYNMFANDIVAFLAAHDLQRHELDELAGIGRGNVTNVLSRKYENHKMDTMLAIANAMDIDVRTYFVLDI